MLYTIGYEGLDAATFVHELRRQDVKVLIDVRELPLSRKRGFSKSALEQLVTAAGLRYIHMRDLGAPREVRHRLRADGDWSEYCSSYHAHLEQQDEALAALTLLANETDICLMCFEADFRTCHRSLISDDLERRGSITPAQHLMPQIERAAAVA